LPDENGPLVSLIDLAPIASKHLTPDEMKGSNSFGFFRHAVDGKVLPLPPTFNQFNEDHLKAVVQPPAQWFMPYG
jgi:hypothetical protein